MSPSKNKRRADSLDRAGTDASGGHAKSARLSDDALIERLLRGDEAAFSHLVDTYHGRLVRLARSFVKDQATAEEVAQETWMGVLGGLQRFEQRSSLKTWIFRILVNRAKTRGLREARSLPVSSLEDAPGMNDSAFDPSRFRPNGRWAASPARWDNDTPEAILMREETRKFLENAIEDLPPRQRTVLVLRDIERVDVADVCALLQITDANQRVMLHRARTTLHSALERHLEEEEDPTC